MIPLIITENVSNEMDSWIRPDNLILDRRVKNRQRLRYLPATATIPEPVRDSLFSEARASVYFAKHGESTLRELLNQEIGLLRAHERLWLSFEPRFRLCFEDYQSLECKKFVCKWWVKVTSNLIKTGRVQSVVEMIKSYMLRLKRHFFRFCYPITRPEHADMDPEERGPPLDGLPRFPTGTWMSKRPVELTREERSLAASFISTRSLPHADGEKVKESLGKHLVVLHEDEELLSTSRSSWLRKMGRLAALELKECYDSNITARSTHAHISITNSATYEKTRSEGGRAAHVRGRLWKYASESPQYGDPMFEYKDYGINDRLHRFSDMPPYQEPIRNTNPDVWPYISLARGFRLEESALFNMLILEAFKDLEDNGWIEWDEDFQSYVRSEKPMPMRRTAVCEPGGKARIVTQTPAAMTTIGQPIQHVLKEVLAADPTLTAGLGAAAQAFEIHKRLHLTNPRPEGEMFFGDFEEATDFVDWGIFCLLWEEFAKVFEIEKDTWLYTYMYELLPSAFVMDDDPDKEPTSRGLLMGLPGTKFALHLINKVLNVFVRGLDRPRTLGELLADPFGAAGDDIFDIDVDKVVTYPSHPDWDEYQYNQLITKSHTVGERYLIGAKLLGMKMSDSKSGMFRGGAPYCEVPILDTDFSAPPWENKGGFMDCIRLRLLSPETKQTKGDDDTSPLVGKAFQFQKELMWQPDIFPGRKFRARYSFLISFRAYVGSYDFHIELHPFLGGLGLQNSSDEELYARIPKWYKRLIGAYLDTSNSSLSMKAVRVFHQWTSDRLARGVGIEYDTDMELKLQPFIAYTDIGKAYWEVVNTCKSVREMLEQGKDEEEIREKIRSLMSDDLTPISAFLPSCPPKEARYIDKVKFLRKFGIIPIRDLVRELSSKDIWDEDTKLSRGFQTMTVQEKTEAQLEFMGQLFDNAPEVTQQDFLKLNSFLRRRDEFVNTSFLHIHSYSRMETVAPIEGLERYCVHRISIGSTCVGDLTRIFTDMFPVEVEPGFFLDLRVRRTARIDMNEDTETFLQSRRLTFLDDEMDSSEEM